MYKCCWNCANGFTVCYQTEFQEKIMNSTKRLCCASRPISCHAENPYKRRYCTQFEPREHFCVSGRELTKEEADKLLAMSDKEQVEYWEVYI